MKPLLFTIAIVIFFSVTALKAQTKAQQDNNQYIAVAQSQKTVGRSHVIHYTLTNNNTVSMDFTLYKQSNDGTWLTTRSLNLAPGGTYDDEGSAIGMTGKYVLYSAPHTAMADFPSFRDMAAIQSGGGASTVAATAPATAPAPAPAVTPTPATQGPLSPPPANTPPPPPTPNTPLPGNPRPVL
jgi:hypothetical protein